MSSEIQLKKYIIIRKESGIMKRKLWGVVLAFIFLASALCWGEYSFVQADVAIRDNVENEATSDTIIIGVEGVNKTNDMKILLDKVNEVRREACYAGNVPDPRNTSRMLQPSDYVELKIGVKCNQAATIRAAEAAIRLGHIRPNNKGCGTILQALGVSSSGENLAWCGDSYTDRNKNRVICFDEEANEIKGWIDEKDNWIQYADDPESLPSGEQMGHYSSLINPSFAYTGMASFNPTNDSVSWDWTCTAGAYTYNGLDTALNTLPGVQSETYIQKIPVLISAVKNMDISGDSILNKGEKYNYNLEVAVYFSGAAENTTVDCPVYDGVTWSSSDESIVSIDENGKATVSGTGKATITATIGSGSNQKKVEREIFAIPEGVTVEGVENPAMVTTKSLKKPVLSKTTKAVLSDGSKVDVDVVWDSYDENKLQTFFTSREFEVKGVALGMEVVQKVHVDAAKIIKLINIYYSIISSKITITKEFEEGEAITTNSGTKPAYPSVEVVFDNGYSYYPFSVTWDAECLDYYKSREGGDFVLTGKASFTLDEGVVKYDVSQPLHVNPATVTSVSFGSDGATITTESGTAPDYPKATVTWSNGDVTEEDITWASPEPSATYTDLNDVSRKYMMKDGGTYTLTGSYNNKSTTVTVKVNPASVTAVALDASDSSEIVPCGTAPVIPEKANATWSNGDKTKEAISWTWNPYSEEDHAKFEVLEGNSFDMVGTCKDFDVTKSVTVLPATIESIDGISKIYTVEGLAPRLPEKVNVHWSNGEEREEPITWNTVPAASYATPNTEFNVSGTVSDFDGNKYPVQVTVHVDEKKLKAITWEEGSPSSFTSYYKYDKADFVGYIIAEFDNGSVSDPIKVTPEMITVFDADSASSSQEITVSYTVSGVTKTLKTQMKLIKRVGIEVATLPEKTEYIEDQNFSTKGIVIKEILDNGVSREIPSEDYAEVTYAGFVSVPETYGKQTISCSIYGFTDTFDINVSEKVLESLSIDKKPDKLIYVQGQSLNLAGIKVTGTYNNGKTYDEVITEDDIWINSDPEKHDMGERFNTNNIGWVDVYVWKLISTEDEDGVVRKIYMGNKLCMFEIIPRESISATWEKMPSRITFPQNDVTFADYGFKDGKLKIRFNDDTYETVDVSQAEISGFDITKVGKQTVTVTYDKKKVTFEAEVTVPEVVKTYVVPPTKVGYAEDEKLDLDGAKIAFLYDNGLTEEIPVDPEDADIGVRFSDGTSITDALTGDNKTLIISYKGEDLKTIDNKDITINISKRTGIRVKKAPDSLVYPEGTPLSKISLEGLQLEAVFENGSSSPIPVKDYALSENGDYDSSTLGKEKVYVNAYGFETFFEITIREKRILSIEVVGNPDKTEYAQGQPFEISGLSVKAYYDNDTSGYIDVTAGNVRVQENRYDPFDVKKLVPFTTDKTTSSAYGVLGYVVVTANYDGETVYFYDDACALYVYDKEVYSIAISKLPAKLTIPQNMKDFNYSIFSDGQITAECNFDFVETLSLSDKNVELSGLDITKMGVQTVTVSYGGKTDTFDVEVTEPIKPVEPVNPSGGNNGGNSGGNNGGNSGNKNTIVTDANGSRYVKADGSYAKSEWVTINGKQYYFNADTYAASNEWRDGKWINADGSCDYAGQLLWKSNATGWWVEDTVGWYPTNSWQKIDGLWYYFNASGYMASGEYYDGYWFNKDGSWDPQYKLSWKGNSSGWWVEDISGWWPSSSWLKIDGYWYYFDASGYMVTSQYVDGWWISADGVCY